MAEYIGRSFGRYHILQQLGEGGMATVYKAYDTRLETDVAVKVIRTENILPSVMDRALKRFEREAKALARLTHPNIVKVIDYGEYEGKAYLVMPYLPGGTLKQRLGKPVSWQEAVHLLHPIAEALDYAHSLGMIHRDVKPSNILMTERGQPMLSDFGIAKILDLDETIDLTGTSAAVGTPEYMAPEQVTAKTVDHRTDIYSLGVVLYEMVTGRKPYTADTPLAVLFKHANDPLPRPKQFVPDLPDAVEKVLIKSMTKDPNDRYQSMAELGNIFEKIIGRQAGSSVAPERAKHESGPKASPKTKVEKLVAVKPKTGNQLFYWLGGLGLLILASIFGLSSRIGKPESTPVMTNAEAPESVVSRPDDPESTEISPTPFPIALVEITGENVAEISLISEKEWRSLWEIDDPTFTFTRARYSPRGSFLIIESDYSEQHLLDSLSLERIFSDPVASCSSIYFSPNEEYMVIGPGTVYDSNNCENTSINVYQINNNVINNPVTISMEKNQYVLGFSLDGQTLIYYFDAHIYWHHIITNETTRTLDVSGVEYLELSPDGKLALGFDTNTGKQGVYSLDHMDLLYELEENNDCGAGHFSPDGKVIRSLGNVNNTKVCIWNADNGSLLRIIDTLLDLFQPRDRFFSPNGEILAGSWSYKISLWSIGDGSLIREFDDTDTDKLHFSPNGDILAGLGSETVYLWDTNSWELLTIIDTKSNFNRGDLIFSPHGRSLTLVGDTNIQVWGVIP